MTNIRYGRNPKRVARMETKPVKSRVITKCSDGSTWTVWGKVLPRAGEQQSWVWDLRVEVSESLLPVVVFVFVWFDSGLHHDSPKRRFSSKFGMFKPWLWLLEGFHQVEEGLVGGNAGAPGNSNLELFQVYLTCGRLETSRFYSKRKLLGHRHCGSNVWKGICEKSHRKLDISHSEIFLHLEVAENVNPGRWWCRWVKRNRITR